MSIPRLLAETLDEWRAERPDLDHDAMGTVLRLGAVMTLALRELEDAFAPLGINLGEFDVLAALRRGGDGCVRTPTTLARVAMVSPAGMTSRLNRLEAAGLIERRPDPTDRRGSLVTLTAAGRDAADRAVEALTARERALLDVLGPAEHDRLDRTLDKLVAHLDARAGATAP